MFLPKSIDLGRSEKYVLSIRIKPNGFMFSIWDPEISKSYCLRETTFSVSDNLLSNIKRIIFDLNFLTQEFKRTNVIIVSSEYDLIPAPFFESKQKEQLYDFTNTKKAGCLFSGLIDKQDIITLFNLDRDIYEFLCRSLWSPHFYHHSNLLTNYIEDKGSAKPTISKMCVNVHDNFMDVICFSNSKLIHSLTYEDEPQTNQLYFILKLWEKCGFNQMTDYLYTMGDVDKSLMIQLQEYIKNIEQINIPSEVYLWSEDAQRTPIDLLTLAL